MPCTVRCRRPIDTWTSSRTSAICSAGFLPACSRTSMTPWERYSRNLRDERLERDTLVVFLSDNGGPTSELTSSNQPLRGGKGEMYEGGIRVPFMMTWPDHLPAGRLYQKPVSSLDLPATFRAIARASPDRAADGVNLLPYLGGEQSARPHETLFWRQGHNTACGSAIGNWSAMVAEASPALGSSTISRRTSPRKPIFQAKGQTRSKHCRAFGSLNSEMSARFSIVGFAQPRCVLLTVLRTARAVPRRGSRAAAMVTISGQYSLPEPQDATEGG